MVIGWKHLATHQTSTLDKMRFYRISIAITIVIVIIIAIIIVIVIIFAIVIFISIIFVILLLGDPNDYHGQVHFGCWNSTPSIVDWLEQHDRGQQGSIHQHRYITMVMMFMDYVTSRASLCHVSRVKCRAR